MNCNVSHSHLFWTGTLRGHWTGSLTLGQPHSISKLGVVSNLAAPHLACMKSWVEGSWLPMPSLNRGQHAGSHTDMWNASLPNTWAAVWGVLLDYFSLPLDTLCISQPKHLGSLNPQWSLKPSGHSQSPPKIILICLHWDLFCEAKCKCLI